jgi:hypothetical protein
MCFQENHNNETEIMREVCNYVMPQLHRKTVKIICGDTRVPIQVRVVIVVVLSSCCDNNDNADKDGFR